MRMTNQKVAILNYLKGVYTHPIAEEVYRYVHKTLPRLSRATVFRNLKQLSTRNDIIEIKTGNASRYDGRIRIHQHLICKKCGALEDVSNARARKFAMHSPGTMRGWKVISTAITYQGLCAKCK